MRSLLPPKRPCDQDVGGGTSHASAVFMARTKTAGALGRLINACIDDQRMLAHESRGVGAGRRVVLDRLSDERSELITTLEGLDTENQRGARSSSWREDARELFREVRTVLGGPSSGDSVTACLQSNRRTEELFDETLALPWPLAIRSVLVDERARLDDARTALIAIKY